MASSSVPTSDVDDGEFDPYSVLGVTRDASSEEIRSVWKRLQKTEHPDKMRRAGVVNVAAAQRAYARLQRAWRILGSPQRKLLFDKFGLSAVAADLESTLVSLEHSGAKPEALEQFFEQLQRFKAGQEFQSRVAAFSDIGVHLDASDIALPASWRQAMGLTSDSSPSSSSSSSRRYSQSTFASAGVQSRHRVVSPKEDETAFEWASLLPTCSRVSLGTGFNRRLSESTGLKFRAGCNVSDGGGTKKKKKLLVDYSPQAGVTLTKRLAQPANCAYKTKLTGGVRASTTRVDVDVASAVSNGTTTFKCQAGANSAGSMDGSYGAAGWHLSLRAVQSLTGKLSLDGSMQTSSENPPALSLSASVHDEAGHKGWRFTPGIYYAPYLDTRPFWTFQLGRVFDAAGLSARLELTMPPGLLPVASLRSPPLSCALTVGKFLSFHDQASASLEIHRKGLQLTLVYVWQQQRLRLPITLSRQTSWQSIAAGLVAFASAVLCGRLLASAVPKLRDYVPIGGLKIPGSADPSLDDEQLRQQVRQRAADAQQFVENWRPLARESAEQQLAGNGLAIIEAYYGDKTAFPSPDGPEPSADPAARRFLDVTVQLQYRIHGIRSDGQEIKLLIPPTSKAAQTGWFDPCPDLAHKTLRIQYMFEGRLHLVEIGEFEGCVIPDQAHLCLSL